MTEPHEYSAALRLFSQTRPLADLKSVLGEPTTSHDLGDPVSGQMPAGPTRQHSYWGYEPAGSRTGRPLDALLADIAEFVEAHRATLELQLDPVLMRRLADLDLRITFDVY
ncbi:MAG TPA: hypothetical protein VN615_10490 [Gaiellales bacterium]|nr:hypothetical protein [Gaiellales bacterium]